MPLDLPSNRTYQSGKWRLVSNAQRFSSPITRVVQSVARPGSFWAATLTIPAISDKQVAADWAAFLARMAGGENSFYLYPPMTDLHTVAGTPLVDGADQAGMTINLKGFTPGDVMRAGGFFHYNTSTFRMLHIVTATTVADGAGEMALPIAPMIRKAPANEAAVTVSRPTCEMVLETADIDLLNLSEAVWYGHTINAVENVRA